MIQLPENYFSFLISIMRYFGIELYEEKESLLYKIYSRVVLFLGLYFYVSLAFLETFLHKDFDTISQIWSYLFSHILGVLKITVLYLNRKEIAKLMKQLQKGKFAPDLNRGGSREFDLVKQTLDTTKFQNTVYAFLLSGCISAGVYTSLNKYFTQPASKWHFAFVPFTIFDSSQSPLFEIVWTYQTLFISNLSYFIAHTDILIITLIAHIAVQFKILQLSILNVEKRAEKHLLDTEGRAESPERERAIKRCLRKDVQHHLAVIGVAEKLEILCSHLVLFVFIADLFVLCLLLYFSSKVIKETEKFPVGSTIFVQHMQYYALVAYQLWMYCSWGNRVTSEGEGIALAAYDCPWIDRPTPYKRAMVLVIQRAHKSIYLTAGKFFPLSYETWLNVVRASVSYFMFLKTMNEN